MDTGRPAPAKPSSPVIPGILEPGRRRRTPRGSPGARFRRRWSVAVRGVPDPFQHLFGKTGLRTFQRGAGTDPARHERRLASARETALPGISGIPGGPAAPARLQRLRASAGARRRPQKPLKAPAAERDGAAALAPHPQKKNGGGEL
eukprot:gene17237-biopygen5321